MLVIKPCTLAEIAFYESANQSHPAFAAYMPTFMGTMALAEPSIAESLTGQNGTAMLASTIPPADLIHDGANGAVGNSPLPPDPNFHGPTKSTKINSLSSIVLENAISGFVKPNVMDLKLGSKLWDDSASQEKRARLDLVSAQTTSGSLGFRITGMKVWQGSQATGAKLNEGLDEEGYLTYGKFYGRKFTAENVVDGLREFLTVPSAGVDKNSAIQVATRFLREARQFKRFWKERRAECMAQVY